MDISLNFVVYQVKGSRNHYVDDFGLGPSVVIGLVKYLPKGNFSVFIDNFFNSIPWMNYLKQKNIDCTDTVKTNMFEDCPLHPKNEFKNQLEGNNQVIKSKEEL